MQTVPSSWRRSRLVPSTNYIPRLFALIIGIDKYPSPYQLFGAVADATAVKKYFRDILQVSEDRICFLINDQATRKRIIKALVDFKNDKHIKKGDPIVIYFAGHGEERTVRQTWGTGKKVQSILPCDFGTAYPIPDHTIGVLIDDIAKEKGDNISVILDCCYSAGGARRANQDYVPRAVELDFDIPPDLDLEITGSRCSSLPSGFTHQGHQSHVLLAACGENELAYERGGHGLFTSALLTILQSNAIDDLSYTQIFEYIRIDKQNQNPQCLGTNRHRILFDDRVPAGRQIRYPARVDEQGNLVINAGRAHGVSHGVEFTLYSDRKTMLGVASINGATVRRINDFQTAITLSETLSLARISFAKLTCVGQLPLYLTTGNRRPMPRGMSRSDITAARLVENIKEAKLQAIVKDHRIAFDILDQRTNYLGLKRLPYTAAPEYLPRILHAASHYFWYLGLANPAGPAELDVAVDFYRVKETSNHDIYGRSFYVPVEPGFCRKEPNSQCVIDFVVDPRARYGVKITNNTPRDLYVNAFLFNNSSLSITPYHTQSSTGNPELQLKQGGGTFAIGYGNGETTSLTFSLRADQNIDVGYLKLFFATLPIDLSDIPQMSPFPEKKSQASIRNWDDGRDGDSAEIRQRNIDIWFTVTIPVVQRRKA